MTMIIEDYQNKTGEHCGSSAMRNLLRYYCNLELREETVFGLGSGLDALFVELDGQAPSNVIFGRSISLELDVADALGVNYSEQPEQDDAQAWLNVRDEVAAGRPTMLTGDVFYLDYRKFKVHFPAHRFVMVGFDDEKGIAWIADRIAPEPQPCSYEALAASRNPPDFISTYNQWGRFRDGVVNRSIEDAHRIALIRSVGRMLGLDLSQRDLMRMITSNPQSEAIAGLPGLRRFAQQLPTWAERADGVACAQYAAGCIESYGTGGGNFRRLYAKFLAGASQVVPDIVDCALTESALASADHWTALATVLGEVSKSGKTELWKQSGEIATEIVDIESRLFETLGRALGV